MHKYAKTCIESRKMNEPVHTFRLATPDDAEALLKIYEPYIATTVTNETQVPALGEFRQRIVERDGAYPYICLLYTSGEIAADAALVSRGHLAVRVSRMAAKANAFRPSWQPAPRETLLADVEFGITTSDVER